MKKLIPNLFILLLAASFGFLTACGGDNNNGNVDPCTIAHNFTELQNTTDPDCETDGYNTYKCSRCDETENQNIPAIGHTFSKKGGEHSPATCTIAQVLKGKCVRCPEESAEPEHLKTGDPLGHSPSGFCERCPTYTITGRTFVQIQTDINADIMNRSLTVTGSVTGITHDPSIFTIPVGKTLTWEANYTSNDFMIFKGGGTVLFNSGSVTCTINDMALLTQGYINFVMNGGTITTNNTWVTMQVQDNSRVAILGGTITNTNTNPTGITGVIIAYNDNILYIAGNPVIADGGIQRWGGETAYYQGNNLSKFRTSGSNFFTTEGDGQNLFNAVPSGWNSSENRWND